MENKQKLLDFFKELNVMYKYGLGVLLIVLITGVSIFFMKDDGYSVLYQDLSEQDRTTILNEIQKMGVEYSETENGSITVKDSDVNWVRKEMTDLGLPSQTSYSYENFFDSSLGTTQSEKELRELASRKGQLESDILGNFTNIEKVSVQLVLPETGSIFDVEAEGGSASVLINQKGNGLTAQQIAGLQHMVATAVPGINVEDVAIIDSVKGVVSLSSEQQEKLNSEFEQQLELVAKTEKEKTEKIRNSLTNFFGQENLEISVNMSINFDEIEQQIETYGDKGTLRSSQKEAEIITKNAEEAPQAGVEDGGDVTTYENVEDGDDSYRSQTTKDIENYEINKTVESIKKHPELTNTNIVVWVDRTTMREKGINEKNFADAVALAAGLTVKEDGTYENGQVSVMLIDKEKEVVVEEEKEPEVNGLAGFFKNNLGILIAIFGVIISALVVALILMNKKNKRKMEEELERLELERLEEEERHMKEASKTLAEKIDIATARDKLRQLNPQPVGLDSMSDEEILRLLEEKHEEIEETEKNKQLQELLEKEKTQLKEKKIKEVEDQIEQLGSEYPKETAEYLRLLLK